MEKIKVEWVPDINQELDSVCNPKNPFYLKEVADLIDKIGRKEFIKSLNIK